jgi:hypothetical protein
MAERRNPQSAHPDIDRVASEGKRSSRTLSPPSADSHHGGSGNVRGLVNRKVAAGATKEFVRGV